MRGILVLVPVMLIDYTVLSVKMEVFLLIIDDDDESIRKSQRYGVSPSADFHFSLAYTPDSCSPASMLKLHAILWTWEHSECGGVHGTSPPKASQEIPYIAPGRGDSGGTCESAYSCLPHISR